MATPPDSLLREKNERLLLENARLRAQLQMLPRMQPEEVLDAGQLSCFGISITKSMTAPITPGKRSIPVWHVRSPKDDHLIRAFKAVGGRWYKPGMCWAFWADPRQVLGFCLGIESTPEVRPCSIS